MGDEQDLAALPAGVYRTVPALARQPGAISTSEENVAVRELFIELHANGVLETPGECRSKPPS